MIPRVIASETPTDLHQGERVSNSDTVSHEVYRTPEPTWNGHFSETLYQCNDLLPPSRLESNVEKVCTIDCKLEDCMPVSKLQNFTTPAGDTRKRLDYNIRMFLSGRTLRFEVEVNGTRLSYANVDVKF